jgi:HEAT repeat protein
MGLLAMVSSAGCQWFRQDPRSTPIAPVLPKSPAGEAKPAASDPQTASSQPAAARVRKALAEPIWTHALPPRDGDPLEVRYRWQHPGLDNLLARDPAHPPDLRGFLDDRDSVVVGNAAIGLARLGNAAGMQQLAGVVHDPDRALAMRCAAVEALGALSGPAALAVLRVLLDEFGNFEPKRRRFYLAELHGELIRAVARHVSPADDPHFTTALRSPSAEVRLATVEAWALAQPIDLPAALADLRVDSDTRVRAGTMRVLGRWHHPESQAWLVAGVNDYELTVRLAAIAALGELGGEEARTLLSRLRTNQPDAIRAAAVSALAQLGAPQLVQEAAKDKSWLVRSAVADALVGYPNRDGVALAQRLLEDPSVEVQRRMLVAIGRWPLDLAGPVLLTALDRPAYVTRKLALDQLAVRWRPAGEFPLEAPPQRRQEMLERLWQQFRQEFGLPNAAVATSQRPPVAPIAPVRVDDVERLVTRIADPACANAERQQALQALAGFGTDLVPALEQLLLVKQMAIPEPVYREVLPKHGVAFETLDRLASGDISSRRRAAESLVDIAQRQPLTRLAASRLVTLMLHEQDSLMWQSALIALERDQSEPAMELAYAAASHPAAEVRRRACLNLAAHPDPRHARVLLPALEDSSEPVVLAAVQAIGQLGRLPDTTALRKMIGTPNESLRVEVAGALARLSDPQGYDVLQRLAYTSDPAIRRRAAYLMGEAADERFVPILIQMLDDQRTNVRQAALESLPKVAGQEPARSDTAVSLDTNEQVRRWKAWYEQHRRQP